MQIQVYLHIFTILYSADKHITKKAVTCKYNSSGFYIARWWNKAHTIRNDSIVWDSFTMGNSCTAVDKSNIRERNRLSKNV